MTRVAIVLVTVCILLTGCGGPSREPPPFEGHWFKYEDVSGGFVEFKSGQITIGDDSGTRSGPYTFEEASDEEPLYRVHAQLPDGEEEFELYYDLVTISLISDDDKISGMYECIVELVPIER